MQPVKGNYTQRQYNEDMLRLFELEALDYLDELSVEEVLELRELKVKTNNKFEE